MHERSPFVIAATLVTALAHSIGTALSVAATDNSQQRVVFPAVPAISPAVAQMSEATGNCELPAVPPLTQLQLLVRSVDSRRIKRGWDVMSSTPNDVLRHLATVEPMEVPNGEPGVTAIDSTGATRAYFPVLSVYLDLRPQVTGANPVIRPSRVLLKARLHQIEQTLWPRGAALDAVHADAARIEEYLDTQIPPHMHGVAIFASSQHHLFEAIDTDSPFDNQVSARAVPDLFQLARLLGERETAVLAIVITHAARLFVMERGGLREVRGVSADPKFFHMVRETNAMNQKHYQSHALHVRTDFARQLADQIEQIVDRTEATELFLAGESEAIHPLRQALSPRIAHMIHHAPLVLGIDTPVDAALEELRPLLRADEAERASSIVEQLIEAVQADALGVAGLEPTRNALDLGQVDTLVLAGDTPISPEDRSALIAAATRTDATVEVVDHSEPLAQLEGVGALLRYRTTHVTEPSIAIPVEETPGQHMAQ